MRRTLAAAALLMVAVAAAPSASAQTGAGLDVRLERDPRPGALSSALAVNLKVTVTDRDTGSPPADRFEVYAYAEPATGTRTEIFPCAHENDNSPDVAPGLYACTVLVDHGGRWRFQAVVNRLRANPGDPPVALGRAAGDFDIDTDEVAAAATTTKIRGRFFEVAVLWSHTAAAAGWLATALLVAVVALPTLRRQLSIPGLHRLEDRFDLLVKSAWTATALLVASGTYLLFNQTAYDTPWSSSEMDAVFRLPYGKPYFLALAGKLALYALMLLASALLLREGRRQLRAGAALVPAAGDDPSPWRAAAADGPAAGAPAAARAAVAVAERRAVETPRTTSAPASVTPAGVRLAAAVLVAGLAGLSLSITLLKYFHELIEAARAVL